MKYKDIFEAIKNNDIEAVKTFLPEHANDKDQNDEQPLYYAISSVNEELLDLLIDNGADVNSTYGSNAVTLLYDLWLYNLPYGLENAVKHGLDLNKKAYFDSYYEPFINYLCREYSKYEKTKIFLKEMLRLGAKIDVHDIHGKLPLNYLSDEDRRDIEAYMANLKAEQQSTQGNSVDFAYEV